MDSTIGENALMVLPVEMWRMILAQITDPADQENISNCSMLFRELLLNQRVHFLLSNVLVIIVLQTTGKQLVSRETKTNKLKLETYKIKTDANIKDDLLNCRLVCSKWNKAVEKCYEKPTMAGNTGFLSKIDDMPGIFKPFVWNMQRFNFYFQPEKANQFLENFKASHFALQKKNPFLGRTAHFEITLDPVNEEIEFVIAVEEILRIFGSEIWYAHLLITSKRGSITAYDYWRVNQYIRCLPNLKYLYLRLNTFKARNIPESFIKEYPLPKLDSLIVLEVCDMDGPILKEIVEKNYHIVYFGIHSHHCFEGHISHEFENLKGVSLTCGGEANRPIINWIQIPPKKLEILKLQQRCVDFDLSNNFAYFNKNFAGSLRDLTLELSFPENQMKLDIDCKNLRLDLPHLKRLAIEFSGVHSLDFILMLKNLEVLELMLIPKEHIKQYEFYKQSISSQQIIQFVGYEQQMHESNIWQKLEKLKKLRVYFVESYKCLDYSRLFY